MAKPGKDCLEWLRFARMDLDCARQLFSQQQNPRLRPIEVIMYHCQQSAEKALKAHVVQCGVLPQKLLTHRLQILRQACASFNTRFDGVRVKNYCAYLDPFSVVVRYPKHNMTLDSSHALRGLNSAKRLFDFVCEQLGLPKVYGRM